MKTTTYLGVLAKQAAATKRHRPAIWENMFGSVYAMNAAGEVRYYDYDWEDAIAFSGAKAPGSDARLARVKVPRSWSRSGITTADPRVGRLVLWVL